MLAVWRPFACPDVGVIYYPAVSVIHYRVGLAAPNNGDKIATLDIRTGHDGDFIAGFSAGNAVRAIHCPHLCHQILLLGYSGARQHAYHHRH